MPHSRRSQRLARLQPTAVNSLLAEMQTYAAKHGEPASLLRGEIDLPTPSHIVEAAKAALDAGRTKYPDNQGEMTLRVAISEYLSQSQDLEYDPETEVLVTTGATFGMYAALMAVLDPGDEVLLPQPIYDTYLSTINLVGAEAKVVPASINDGPYTLNPDTLRAACSERTKALILNTPWNPTGTVLRDDEIASFMEIAQEHDLLVISDEIYEHILYDGRHHVSPAAIDDDARQRTIVINSLSKSYCMTGWRLGYCVAPPDLLEAMFLVLQQSSRGAATFVQDAGVAALQGSQDCLAEIREVFAERRQQLCDALFHLPKLKVFVPEGGFFAMLDVRQFGAPSAEISHRLLYEHGVAVMPGSVYGDSAEGTLRVSFAVGGKALAEGLSRLRQGLIDLGAEA